MTFSLQPLGQPFTTSRKQFLMQHVGFNEGNPGYKVEGWLHTCDKVIFRWVAKTEVPVRGIEILEAVPKSTGWRIKTDYTEFNSVALLANYGICPGGPCPDNSGA
jgi:hypothetical protein